MDSSSSTYGGIPSTADGVDALNEINLLFRWREVEGIPAELIRIWLSIGPVGNEVAGIDLDEGRVANRGTNAVKPTMYVHKKDQLSKLGQSIRHTCASGSRGEL